MSDSFLHFHQSALDSQRENDAIQIWKMRVYIPIQMINTTLWRLIMTSKLEQIRDSLDKYIKEELEKSPSDRDWEVWTFEDDLYEIIESFDQIIYYDPTP